MISNFAFHFFISVQMPFYDHCAVKPDSLLQEVPQVCRWLKEAVKTSFKCGILPSNSQFSRHTCGSQHTQHVQLTRRQDKKGKKSTLQEVNKIIPPLGAHYICCELGLMHSKPAYYTSLCAIEIYSTTRALRGWIVPACATLSETINTESDITPWTDYPKIDLTV